MDKPRRPTKRQKKNSDKSELLHQQNSSDHDHLSCSNMPTHRKLEALNIVIQNQLCSPKLGWKISNYETRLKIARDELIKYFQNPVVKVDNLFDDGQITIPSSEEKQYPELVLKCLEANIPIARIDTTSFQRIKSYLRNVKLFQIVECWDFVVSVTSCDHFVTL